MNAFAVSTNFAFDHDSAGQAIPHNLLKSLVENQVTGKLTIQNPFDEFVNWQVYLGNGKIHFANSATGSVERLNYLIGSPLHQRKISLPPQIDNDYQYLCELWKKNIFSFQQTRSILTQATQEALVQILSLPKTTYTFERESNLETLFLNLDLTKVTTPIKHKIRYWWELRSDVNSPFQRPLVENWDRFNHILSKTKQYSQNWLKQFHHCLEDLNCLYSIASSTDLSTLQLALMMRPLIKTGEIKMLPYQEIQTDNRPLIISVSDRPGEQRVIQYTLESGGFRTLTIEDPFKALAVLLSQQPNVILINEAMNEINGYQLCSLFRKSSLLKNVPILMLGERNDLTSRIRGKLAGASGYIHKPVLPQTLLTSVNQALNISAPAVMSKLAYSMAA